MPGTPHSWQEGFFMKGFFIFLLYCFAYFVVFWLWFYLIFHIGRRRTIKEEGIEYCPPKKKKKSFHPITDIFFKLPYQVGKDHARSKPDDFRYKGIVIFTGEQGQGKSISMIQFARSMKEEFPDALVLSNTQVDFQDMLITDYKPICELDNGTKGIILILDELQNWFCSKQSLHFPPEMLSVVTQQRKARRILLGTAQQFYMLSKDIRSQCSTGEIRSCHTIAGAFTIVVRKKPYFDAEGNLIKTKFLGLYGFVHDDDLRNCYDTYATVKNLSQSGFIPASERSSVTNYNNNYYFRQKRR